MLVMPRVAGSICHSEATIGRGAAGGEFLYEADRIDTLQPALLLRFLSITCYEFRILIHFKHRMVLLQG